MQDAPFHAAVADGPAGGRAYWLTASDGVRIRIGVWTDPGAKGTVLLFPGRTEYVEKYGRAAEDLRQRGYATVAIDWRGQGLADRLIKDGGLGHVTRFLDYQKDVEATLAALPKLDLPKPLYLIAHSMGGAIGLRAVLNGLGVKAAAFSAPMWGILIAPWMRPVAWALSTVATPLGFGGMITPGTSRETYVAAEPFEDNMLTKDREMFAYMNRQVTTHSELALGGPTLTWLNQALIETRALMAAPSPTLPCYTALGSDERIVDPRPVHRKMGSWPGARLDMVEGAEHEIMMETPARRSGFFDAATGLFDANP